MHLDSGLGDAHDRSNLVKGKMPAPAEGHRLALAGWKLVDRAPDDGETLFLFELFLNRGVISNTKTRNGAAGDLTTEGAGSSLIVAQGIERAIANGTAEIGPNAGGRGPSVVRDIPEEVRQSMTFTFVSSMDEVLHLALLPKAESVLVDMVTEPDGGQLAEDAQRDQQHAIPSTAAGARV